MNVLLLGGSGQLGREIQRRWNDVHFAAPSHAELDIADRDAMARELERGYDLVVNCAAYHNVDECEKNPEAAFQYNAVAVGRLASQCAERGTEFMTISTDYVFDGEANTPYSESASPNPIQTYGVSKLAGELLAQNQVGKIYVVRTCGVYGTRPSITKGHTFIDRILAQIRAGERPSVVGDVVATPTFAGDLAVALQRLVGVKAYGLTHVVNRGAVSWYHFAAEAARQAGLEGTICQISASNWTAVARRPRYSALATDRLDQLNIEMPEWREGIAGYLLARQADSLI